MKKILLKGFKVIVLSGIIMSASLWSSAVAQTDILNNITTELNNQAENDLGVHNNPFYNNPGGVPNDNIAVKNHTQNKTSELIPPLVRESDITWSKRVWRAIDLNQRLNLPLKEPVQPIRGRMSLYEVLVRSIITPDPEHPNKRLAAFDWPTEALDFTFKTQIETTDQLRKILTKRWSSTNAAGVTIQDSSWYVSSDIVQYNIMEEWFFDKKRSQLDVRIIALAPLAAPPGPNAQPNRNVPPTPLFIVYFPQARWFLNRYEVFNANNNSEYRTFYQIFLMRRFSSYIYKEENVYDRRISQYALGIDALLEAERIENEIQEFEFDLWEE